MKIASAGAAAAAVVVIAAAPATASVSFDSSTGTGFVGKGDVQTALGWNNAALQKNASSLTFTTSQPASQALSQSASQSASQSVSQSVTRMLSCTVTNGSETNSKTFVRDGYRLGERVGTRTGTRTGSRSGVLSGTISYGVAYDPRVKNQVTGFNLTGQRTTPAFTASGEEFWDAVDLGEYFFGADAFGDIDWKGWRAESGENPAACDSNNPHVSNVNDVTTFGDVSEGELVESEIAYDKVAYGEVVATGPAVLYVNGVALNG